MKHFRVYRAILGFTILSFVAAVSFEVPISRGQSQSLPVDSRPKAFLTKSPQENLDSDVFKAASVRNGILKDQLAWTFGGKQQRGWYLYLALIDKTLNTEADAGSSAFSKALAQWQKRLWLEPNGVLDEVSLSAMVSQWQSNRLKNRMPAQPEQLITVGSSDFYDPDRVAELRQVERETYAAYKRMVAAAEADPALGLRHNSDSEPARCEKCLKIISAFRSREYQDQLRRQFPNAGTAGLAVNSPHFTGRALDLYVGGDPVETKDSNRAIQVQTPVYQWLVRNAERFGFRPYFYEPWHWEYVR